MYHNLPNDFDERLAMTNTFDSKKKYDVKKAVIPAAGLGTRFLPLTKVLPKELLPIGTKPIIQVIIEELIDSGISEVIIINSPFKKGLEAYFDKNTQYDHLLKAQGKSTLLNNLNDLINNITIKWVYQNEPKGLGHAILCAKEAVGNEPFVICLPDIIIESKTPCAKQMIDIYQKVGEAINATEKTPKEKIELYGIYDIASSDGKLHKAKGVIEKPRASEAPSDLCVVGRYLFGADVFNILESTSTGFGGEIQLADAMNTLARQGRMYAYEYEGMQFDTGDKLGFFKTNVYYGNKEFPGEFDDLIDRHPQI